jgi:hypothetical protein
VFHNTTLRPGSFDAMLLVSGCHSHSKRQAGSSSRSEANFQCNTGGGAAYSRRKQGPNSNNPGLANALVVSDFNEVMQPDTVPVDLSVEVGDAMATVAFKDTSSYKYKPREVLSAKLEETMAVIGLQPQVDLGSIDSIVLRQENLLQPFGQEKLTVALHSRGRNATVNLLGPLVDQVTGTPLQPGDVFGKDQVAKLLGLHHETVTDVCQPWHSVNTPSAAVCNQSYKNENRPSIWTFWIWFGRGAAKNLTTSTS